MIHREFRRFGGRHFARSHDLDPQADHEVGGQAEADVIRARDMAEDRRGPLEGGIDLVDLA